MNGGTFEYVTGYISGKPGSSGFNTTTLSNYDAKYFDLYNAASTETTYQYRILGDGVGEMGPYNTYVVLSNVTRYQNSWYNDSSNFVYSSLPWFTRGGDYSFGILSGSFAFSRSYGSAVLNGGFRIILTP